MLQSVHSVQGAFAHTKTAGLVSLHTHSVGISRDGHETPYKVEGPATIGSHLAWLVVFRLRVSPLTALL